MKNLMKEKKMKIILQNKNIISVELLNEKITKKDIKNLEKAIDSVHEKFKHVNIIILISKLKGITLAANIEAIKMLGSEKGVIKKIAVVSDNNLYSIGVKIDNLFTPWKEKYFSSADLNEAWEWLKSE